MKINTEYYHSEYRSDIDTKLGGLYNTYGKNLINWSVTCDEYGEYTLFYAICTDSDRLK